MIAWMNEHGMQVVFADQALRDRLLVESIKLVSPTRDGISYSATFAVQLVEAIMEERNGCIKKRLEKLPVT